MAVTKRVVNNVLGVGEVQRDDGGKRQAKIQSAQGQSTPRRPADHSLPQVWPSPYSKAHSSDITHASPCAKRGWACQERRRRGSHRPPCAGGARWQEPLACYPAALVLACCISCYAVHRSGLVLKRRRGRAREQGKAREGEGVAASVVIAVIASLSLSLSSVVFASCACGRLGYSRRVHPSSVVQEKETAKEEEEEEGNSRQRQITQQQTTRETTSLALVARLQAISHASDVQHGVRARTPPRVKRAPKTQRKRMRKSGHKRVFDVSPGHLRGNPVTRSSAPPPPRMTTGTAASHTYMAPAALRGKLSALSPCAAKGIFFCAAAKSAKFEKFHAGRNALRSPLCPSCAAALPCPLLPATCGAVSLIAISPSVLPAKTPGGGRRDDGSLGFFWTVLTSRPVE